MFAGIIGAAKGLKAIGSSEGLSAVSSGRTALSRSVAAKRPAKKRKKNPTSTAVSAPTRRPRLAIRRADRSGVGLNYNG
jgi:hypothetical protein